MGMPAETEFLRQALRGQKLPAPTLEVGSLAHNEEDGYWHVHADEFAEGKIVGLDIVPGKNVDVVHDLSLGSWPFQPSEFNSVICCSVLEHVQRPWMLCANLERLIAPGGMIYVSVPWVHRFHKYDDDYWRMTPSAVKTLLPNIEWDAIAYSVYGYAQGTPLHFVQWTDEVDNQLGLVVPLLGPKGELYARKYLPYLMLHMIGRKK